MRNAKYIPFVAFVTLGLLSCYNPLLPDDPFLCGEGGKCPDGYKCYGGTCLKKLPACMDPSHPDYLNWPNDQDLEPNDHPSLAVVLPCGDDAVFTNPVEYVIRCPSRHDYTNGFNNLLTCPNGDRDFYAIYLLPEETVTFKIIYNYNSAPPRDIDGRVWRWNFPTSDWRNDVALGLTTNDYEELTFNTIEGSNNPQGWYYLEVFGKTYQDLNFYAVTFTLNASQIASP
jgi:hypothetical protein